MPKAKKDNKSVTVRLATPIVEQLEKFCEDAGQTKTAAIERALVMYMDDYYKKQEQLEKMNAPK